MEIMAVNPQAAVAAARVVVITTPQSAPVRRLIRHAAQEGRVVDLTRGQPRRAALILDSGHVVLAAVAAETLIARWGIVLGESTAQPGEGADR